MSICDTTCTDKSLTQDVPSNAGRHTSATEATAKSCRQGHITRRSQDMETEQEGGEAERDFRASKSDPECLSM